MGPKFMKENGLSHVTFSTADGALEAAPAVSNKLLCHCQFLHAILLLHLCWFLSAFSLCVSSLFLVFFSSFICTLFFFLLPDWAKGYRVAK